MGLCQHVYRRGGIYWWRRHGLAPAKNETRSLNMSLKVREPIRARILGRIVSVEADKIAERIWRGMLLPDQEKALLKQFIDEQIRDLDWVAIKNTRLRLFSTDGEALNAVSAHRRMERILSIVFRMIAVGGVTANVTSA
jgi:hypothetical protein